MIKNKEEIKKVLMRNTVKGKSFYPDELAFKHDMDLKIVMEVTHELVKEGYVE